MADAVLPLRPCPFLLNTLCPPQRARRHHRRHRHHQARRRCLLRRDQRGPPRARPRMVPGEAGRVERQRARRSGQGRTRGARGLGPPGAARSRGRTVFAEPDDVRPDDADVRQVRVRPCQGHEAPCRARRVHGRGWL
ncbi:hypothetical protein IEO21_10024 [Rhodonia placenta]|uniref:Uncharacterized protein n=1 Tax=Rhodonia placenta TaxID=104341 RepID=A0A8H7NT76_9APHY|nr:hypothetical protein IEO21_10024 [Postia placenta]